LFRGYLSTAEVKYRRMGSIMISEARGGKRSSHVSSYYHTTYLRIWKPGRESNPRPSDNRIEKLSSPQQLPK